MLLSLSVVIMRVRLVGRHKKPALGLPGNIDRAFDRAFDRAEEVSPAE